jgi:Domain of unknown function (DUF4917)
VSPYRRCAQLHSFSKAISTLFLSLISADFSSKPHIKTLFQKLGTQDFEVVIKHLLDAASVLDAYGRTDPKLAKDFRSDAAAIKDALALQLSFFEMGTLSGGLVSSAPE